MRAINIIEAGGVENLSLVDISEPQVKDGEVKIKVRAFGINRAETYYRAGNFGETESGRILGIEAAGEIVADPSGRFKLGQKVITAMGGLMLAKNGSYAEYLIANSNNVLAIDSDIGFNQLASLPMAYLTAWGALDLNMKISRSETLLVRGATSSIGMATLCYAKARGLSVIATTRKAANVARLEQLGADHVLIDEGEIADQVKSLYPNGIEGVVDVVGASSVKDSAKVLKPWGNVVVVGVLSGAPIIEQFNLMGDLPMTSKLSFFGSGLLGSAAIPLDNSPLNWVAEQVRMQNIPDITARVFSFEDIAEAHRIMEADNALGKLVVSVQ